MIKFLLQTVDDKIRHDFVFELENAIEYQNWRGNEMQACYCSLEDIQNGNTGYDVEDLNEVIPVGTIEFVYAFIDNFIKKDGSKKIKPLNIPTPLTKYAGRKLKRFTLVNDKFNRYGIYEKLEKEIPYSDEYVFIKSEDTIKNPVNGPHRLIDITDMDEFPQGNYVVSEDIEIISEYRCFVYKDQLVGIQYYSGECYAFPESTEIFEMIDNYKWDNGNGPAPQAYTLDVAVTTDDKTVIIECHEFFSCGTYGFNDYSVLPYMFVRTWQDIKKRLQ